MKHDRFLVCILIGTFFLVASALTLFFIHKSQQRYLSEDTPAGVVHNYILAIEKGDYERAYRYLADSPHKPTYDMFLSVVYAGWSVLDERQGVEIGETLVTGEQAIVELIIIYDASYSAYYADEPKALLIRQNGAWKIRDIDWGGWRWNWY